MTNIDITDTTLELNIGLVSNQSIESIDSNTNYNKYKHARIYRTNNNVTN